MNENHLSKAFIVYSLASGTILLVSLPALIVSHVKSKKEHPELKGSSQGLRDDLLVACATGTLAGLASRAIYSVIESLKKK